MRDDKQPLFAADYFIIRLSNTANKSNANLSTKTCHSSWLENVKMYVASGELWICSTQKITHLIISIFNLCLFTWFHGADA